MAHLFSSLTLRGLTFPHRIVVSPMCQYSSTDGFANDWHLVHLGSRAVGGAAMVLTEATAVTADGRISPQDLGIWQDGHIEALSQIVRFVHSQQALAGIQIAHAGRKASTPPPWDARDGQAAVPISAGGWQPAGPTSEPFAVGYPMPRALDTVEIRGIVKAFQDAACRALTSGFDVVEVHAAHGYLLHEFLSPLVNTRTDAYGGSFENRIRLCVEVVEAVRAVWPERLPVFVRISATDWVTGGWEIEQSVELSRRLAASGADLIDCSSGGAVSYARVPVGPDYQVPFAERIRHSANVPTGAVGLITQSSQADAIIRTGQADCVLLAREMLRDPYWPQIAAQELGELLPRPKQYLRAAPHGMPAR